MVSPGCALWIHLHVSGEATLLSGVRLNTAGSCMGPFLCDTGFLDRGAPAPGLPIRLVGTAVELPCSPSTLPAAARPSSPQGGPASPSESPRHPPLLLFFQHRHFPQEASWRLLLLGGPSLGVDLRKHGEGLGREESQQRMLTRYHPHPPEVSPALNLRRSRVQPGVVIHRSFLSLGEGRSRGVNCLVARTSRCLHCLSGRLRHWARPSDSRAQMLNRYAMPLRLITIFESLSLKPTWCASAVFFPFFSPKLRTIWQ